MSHGNTVPYILEVERMNARSCLIQPMDRNYKENGTARAEQLEVRNDELAHAIRTGVRVYIVEEQQMNKTIIDETYQNREPRIYEEYAPTLRLNCGLLETVEKKVLVKQATKEGVTPCKVTGAADLSFPDSTTRRGRVIDEGDVVPTIHAQWTPDILENWTWSIDGVTYLIRIRKLTPRECWRLMDFTDEDYEKAAAVNSQTQLYKQAGNSIVKSCLMEIFKEIL